MAQVEMAEKEEDLLAGAVDNGHDVLSEEQLLGEEPIEIKQEVKDEMDLYDAVTEPTSDKDTSMLVQASSVPSTPVAASKPAVQTTQTHTSYGGKKYCCYIGNMTWWTTDADLQVAVANCGLTDLCDIKFHENRTNGQSKGFCLAVFYSENSVRVLTEKLPLRPVHGQTLVVLPYSKVSLSRLEDATAKTQTRVDKKDKKFEEETPNVMNMGTIRIGVNGISAVGPPAGMIGGGPGPGGPMMGPGGGGRPMGGPMGGGPGIMGPGNAMGGGGMMGPGGMRQGANPMMMMTGPPVGMRPAVSMGGPSIGMGQLPMGGGNQMQMGPRPNMSGPPPGAGMNRPGGMMTGPPPGAMSGPPPGSMSGPPPGTMAGPPIHTNVPPPVFVSSTAPPQPLLSRQVAPPPLHMGGPQQQSSSLPPPGAHVNPNVYPVFQAHEAPPPLSDAELEEVMSRNKTVASSAISRAISDATGGDHATAMETLLTAITLIKQSRASADERCKLLISSLHDTLSGIEAKMSSRKHGNSRRDRSRSRSRERKRHRRGSRSRSRSRTRSPRRKY